ncbi:hypothetical protein Golob_016096, partial [Gossypium lobatum]|nr:hypothetical protein [Gossypium lobatum]
RDWNTFGQYLCNHRPPLSLSRCSGAHVLEFLRYLDQFGKTKVHTPLCPFFGHPNPPAPCPCPLRQAWGSLDALIGRLRAAFEEHGGKPEANPFGARAVRLYLREVRDSQAKARGISYEKKKRKRPPHNPPSLPPPNQYFSLFFPLMDNYPMSLFSICRSSFVSVLQWCIYTYIYNFLPFLHGCNNGDLYKNRKEQ